MIAARSRGEMDLKLYLGTYEFSVVPRSLFAADGTLYSCQDKSKVAKALYDLQVEETPAPSNDKKVIIFNGMAVVNRISIKKMKLKTCRNFAEKFVEIIYDDSNGYDEIRIIFDLYESASLKNKTRATRTKGLTPIRYKITDDTPIGYLTTRKLLSHIETKNELTKFLAKKIEESMMRSYVVVYQHSCITNLSDLNPELRNYSQEEADTGIILHSIDVAKRDPFCDLTIKCSDTDVLLLLLHYFKDLPSTTTFETNEKKKFLLGQLSECIGEEKCAALLGFHAITDCDQTGSFNGFSKEKCWKSFMSSDVLILNAFSNLGSNLDNSVKDGIENYVIRLYADNLPQINNFAKTVDSLADLRYQMVLKSQSESEKLPPTKSALVQKILRAHYTAMVWKLSHIPSPELPVIQKTMVGNLTPFIIFTSQ